jgi:D-xylose transport system substrate-binding protein
VRRRRRRQRERRRGGGGRLGGGGKTIALLLPETKTTRYEEKDRPLFEAKVKELCPDCKVFYQNASQDANKQQQQADAAITKGASVLVLDAVDVASVGPIVQHANQKNIPVIAYDRLIPDQDIAFYVSFDNVKQGRVQAQSLLDKLGSADGKSIVMVNGAPTDPSAGDYKKGAHQVFDKSGLKIAKEFDTPDWSPDKAQTEMEQSITSLGKDGFAGVYSANDGMAGGIIAAMKGSGVDPQSKPVTGRRLRGGRDPAHPDRRAALDDLPGHQAAGRDLGRARGRRGARQDGSGRDRQGQGGQRLEAGGLRAARPDRGDQGQHPGHRHQGRLPDRRRDLHRQVRRRLQGGRDSSKQARPG